MRKATRALLIAAGMMVSVTALADSYDAGFYLGGGYTGAKVDSSGFSGHADVGMLFGRAGYQVNQNVALEARVGSGIDDGNLGGAKVEAQGFYGGYLKAGLPTESGFYPYVLLGMTHAKFKFSGAAGHATSSGSDFSYGAGVDYWFNYNVSAGLEYARLYDKDGIKADGWTLGLNYQW